MAMFCRQCEQTAQGKGCTLKGVCGKDDRTAAMQDLLIYALQGIAVWGRLARDVGVKDASTDRFLMEGLFTTVTNVDFDEARCAEFVAKSRPVRERIRKLFLDASRRKEGRDFSGALPTAAGWEPAGSPDALLDQAKRVGMQSDPTMDEDVRSLREILLYGMKGMAAYADHAAVLGRENEEVNAFFHKGLAALAEGALPADTLLSLVLECGRVNLKCMETLDGANTGAYGHPVPTRVSLGVRKGPAILVSGHDLRDLQMLLEQTEGKGVNVYTHGEMLPCHGYPGLKKFKHLAGHYGTAWQNQQKEFPAFPGAILMTTNCLQKPLDGYRDRVFTTGLVAFPGLVHIPAGGDGRKDFSPVLRKAIEAGGFPQDVPGREITVGFARNAVLGVAGPVIEAVKAGRIRRFFLIGGCDGAKPGRNYYTEFAEKVPKDCVILTLACGKFRFHDRDFGDIGGIPRLLDCGQCNDAYSAIRIALALAEAFRCSVNDLPLSLVLSWYEQKAVVILLTLLALGVRNIRLGPSLPAFVSPNVLRILVEKFAVQPVATVDGDLKAALAGK